MTVEPDAARPERGCRDVVAQFMAIATARPEAPAIVSQGRLWSYREVTRRAATIGQALAQAGARPGQTVAVLAHRSMTQVAAWLAVLARRAVLFPLDPATSPTRQEVMLGRADVACVLTLGSVTAPHGARAVRVADADADSSAATLELQMGPPPGGRDPGYLVFTSGSTGLPKAIVGRARSLAHFLDWQAHQFTVGPGDRVAHLASPEFDVALREVFLPLTTGAVLCLPPPGPLPATRALAWLAQERVTVAHMVPTVVRAWLRSSPAGVRLPDLRLALFNGEPLPEELVCRWREQLDYQGQIINLYGPTETTMIRCWHVVRDPAEPGVQPLGRPIADSQVWVQRRDDQPAGVGEVGEIVIRTAFGTNGYLGATAQESARFTATADGSDDVVYRTGDLGHLDRSDVLHFDGRLDDQVKIYGVRIHLGAIEAAIETQPEIDQAAVIAEPNAEGTPPRLTAYLILKPGQSRIPPDLRSRLRHLLAPGAIPARFLTVSALPSTPVSGKLDRRGLASLPLIEQCTPDHQGQR